jgi:cytochrome P450
MQQVTYDLWDPEVRNDPYPLFRKMREENPIHWDGYSWFLTRHADVLFAFTDARFSAERLNPTGWLAPEELADLKVLYDVSQAMMLFRDPPAHSRLRGLVAQAFSARMMEGMRPRIQAIVDGLLDEVVARGEFDVIRDLANPLPGIVIAELLGVPAEDQPKFKHWANEYAAFLGGIGDYAQMRQRGKESVLALGQYIQEVAARRRVEPRDDLITALVQAEEQGDKLSELELVATVFLLLFAGNETTTNLIGNGILTLLRQPEAAAQLRAHPGIIRTAIEELLRYESPVQMTNRWAREDLEIDGQQILAGQNVQTLLGAANRDPEQFPDPDRLDLTRRPNRHIAFAHGIHFCLGAPLARFEGQVAINSVMQRFPRLALVSDEVEWQANDVFRSLRALPLLLEG